MRSSNEPGPVVVIPEAAPGPGGPLPGLRPKGFQVGLLARGLDQLEAARSRCRGAVDTP
jgi:hypothetical protein